MAILTDYPAQDHPEAGFRSRSQFDIDDLRIDLLAGELDREARRKELSLGLQVGVAGKAIGADTDPRSSGRVILHPDGKIAKAVYRKVSRRSRQLTDLEFRVLDALLERANSDFANCFPGYDVLAQEVGGGRKAPLDALGRALGGLERKGWVERIRYLKEDGKFSSNGYRFRLPPNEIAEGHPGWEGPVAFDNHTYVKRRKQ